MSTCHSFLFLSFFYYFFSHVNHSFKSDHFVHHDFNSNSSSAILLNTESRFSIMLIVASFIFSTPSYSSRRRQRSSFLSSLHFSSHQRILNSNGLTQSSTPRRHINSHFKYCSTFNHK